MAVFYFEVLEKVLRGDIIYYTAGGDHGRDATHCASTSGFNNEKLLLIIYIQPIKRFIQKIVVR